MSKLNENQLLLITGPAGAGRTTAIHVLEDIGYETIDNLPIHLLRRLLNGDPLDKPLAIGVDARTRGFAVDVLLEIATTQKNPQPVLVFLDCDNDTLLRRYNETRRRHPLAPNETPIIGIKKEKDLLLDLKAKADVLIDTSYMSPHDLKSEMKILFDTKQESTLSVSIHSFSYKRGTPRGIDMILDCRFLQNPHWQESLRAFDGRDEEVAKFVKADPMYDTFFKKLCGMCHLLLPAYRDEGKSYFSIGLGCSGGKHRSVCVAEDLASNLKQDNWQISVRHRELEHHL